MSEDNTLKINVAEDIKMTDMGLGGQQPELDKTQLVADGKKIMEDEIARYYENTMKYIQRYVPPHKVKSRWVTSADLEYILKEGDVMMNLCVVPHGMYGNAEAIAHSQIEDKHPLRFFVTRGGMVFINPVIVSHTEHPVFKDEGCMSFPSEPIKTMIKRFNKITVRYQMLVKGEDGKPEISSPKEITYKGKIAEIFQHECAHLNGHYIYDEDADPLHAIGLDDGTDPKLQHVEGLVVVEE